MEVKKINSCLTWGDDYQVTRGQQTTIKVQAQLFSCVLKREAVPPLLKGVTFEKLRREYQSSRRATIQLRTRARSNPPPPPLLGNLSNRHWHGLPWSLKKSAS